MGKSLRKETATLALQALVTEGSQKVWGHFERAVQKMDAESVYLLREYFSGASVAVLSRERNIPEKQVADWLARAKRELIQRLKTECRIKH